MNTEQVERYNEFLAHYGKKGMKWGYRKNGEARSDKQMARMTKRANKGDKILDKSGGSVKSAALKIAGRRVAVAVIAGAAQMAVSKLPGSPGLKMGLNAVADLTNKGMFVKDIVDTTRLVSATRRRADSEED